MNAISQYLLLSEVGGGDPSGAQMYGDIFSGVSLDAAFGELTSGLYQYRATGSDLVLEQEPVCKGYRART